MLKSLWAEMLKTRRTLALLLTVIAPTVIVVFVVAFYFQRQDFFRPVAGGNPWNQFSQLILVYWNLLMLPLFITLETALQEGFSILFPPSFLSLRKPLLR